MTNVLRKVEKKDTSSVDTFVFFCPACKCGHYFDSTWYFNGDMEKPTVSPSVLVTWDAVPDASDGFKEWRTKRVCHSFVKDGEIQFLGDCTHDQAGKTLKLETF